MKSRPVRLQLSRRRGFKLQEHSRAVNGLDAVKVDRSTWWGNPWRVGVSRCHGHGFDYSEEPVKNAATAIRFFADMLSETPRRYQSDHAIVRDLRGRNLACWCRLCPRHAATGKPFDEPCPDCAPCHADVLGARANGFICEEVAPCS